jgi:hypothetical protein
MTPSSLPCRFECVERVALDGVVILAPYCNGLLEVGLSGGPGPGWDGSGQGWIYMVGWVGGG